jgi:peptidoglycan/xylan/chitin deacetylase (PgdA/CDA1 family)
MAEQPRRDRSQADRSTELQNRRERRRRQVRRRRLLAFGAILATGAAVAILVAVSGSDSSNNNPGRGRSSSRIAATNTTSTGELSRTGGGPVRNASPQPGWRTHTGPVPILEYHVLGSPEAGAPYPELYVSRPDFHRQMDWLEEQGYQAVTLEQVERAWYDGGALPPKPVVLSFDDGYRPQFTYALPELRRHGWAGVLNLKAEGSDLYPSNVEAMIAAGWELAAHTIHHLDLTELGPEQLTEEVAGSRRMLRREFHVPVRNFCYPAGQFDETVVRAVEAAGYVGATTEIPGYATRAQPYELARFEILRSTGVSGLAEDLRTGEGETGEIGA